MTAPDPQLNETEQARANLYRLLGAALSHPPTATLLGILRGLPDRQDESPVGAAIGQVADAARAATLNVLQRNYHALFIGVARGELMPYASFYLTGFLHDRPLARLRSEIADFGLAAVQGHPDPEDHAGTVCELMAGLIDGEHGAVQPLDVQRRFFDHHMAPWLVQFFADLEAVRYSALYAAIGTLGRALLTVERLAFQMETS